MDAVAEMENWKVTYDTRWDALDSQDKAAKEAGRLVGRYIKEGIADGAAIYEIIKETKKSVRIRVVTGLGDDWRVPYWGDEALISKQYAVRSSRYRMARLS